MTGSMKHAPKDCFVFGCERKPRAWFEGAKVCNAHWKRLRAGWTWKEARDVPFVGGRAVVAAHAKIKIAHGLRDRGFTEAADWVIAEMQLSLTGDA